MTNQTATVTSLYERLGGYDALAAAVDDLLPRLQGDPQLGVYWRGQNDHTKKRGRQMLLDFLVSALGGPAIYNGLDMNTELNRPGAGDRPAVLRIRSAGDRQEV